MKRKDLKFVRKICDMLDMHLEPEGNHQYDLSFYSNAGEDFHTTITEGRNKNFSSAAFDVAYNFDPEEHAMEWYGADRGEPTSVRDLLDDADYIANQLDKFADYCARYFGQGWDWEAVKCEILNDQYFGRV